MIRSQEYKPFIWVIILVIAFHLKDEIMIEREVMDAKMWALLISAFILGALDLLGELIKRRKRS
ncbi:MAG: hypothetical protein H8D54_04495 [Candidatus Omnitrophica bacterium]|nr:hypothetical protein [Candidatus Omnitrophota bacterium]